MIRFAEEKDFDGIVSLWERSFPNEEPFSNWFFKSAYSIDNTLIFEKNGSICSMLQRIPFQMRNIGAVTYIFSACTHPDFRGQGLMSELLRYSEALDNANNFKASVLIPRSEQLFAFYKEFGYEPEFHIFNAKYSKQNPMDHSYLFRECTPNDVEQLNVLYEKKLANSNFILRDKAFWMQQLSMFRHLGGNVFALLQENELVGYAFVWNDNGVQIQELVGLNNDVKTIICHEIMQFFNVDTADTFSLTGKSSESALGCIKLYEPVENGLPFVMNLMYN